MVGTVNFIAVAKGYGFIQADERSQRVFFHASEVDESLAFDEQLMERRVRFEVKSTDRGLRAIGVKAAE
jgi:cold shock CspA family protein